MSTSVDIQTALTEIAVDITNQLAERLAHAAQNMQPADRQRIMAMIEEQLPTVVTNTLFKTTVLHTPKGIDHLRENQNQYAEQILQMLIKNDD